MQSNEKPDKYGEDIKTALRTIKEVNTYFPLPTHTITHTHTHKHTLRGVKVN